jgi:uncharacterized protein (DUF1499 family)
MHAVTALVLRGAATKAWATAREVVAGLAQTRVITDTPDYLHAECESALLGFVDDVELHLRVSDGIIAVRAASRLGIGDLGVNRRRIENLRTALAHLGVVE